MNQWDEDPVWEQAGGGMSKGLRQVARPKKSSGSR